MRSPGSFDGEKLDFERQGRVWWDARNSLFAVCQLWRDDELPLASDLHASDAFVPAVKMVDGGC